MKIKLNLSLKLKDDRTLGYAEYGDPNGEPIFYFHGLPGSRLEASHFHDIAIKNHYRIISIDRPGMGLSSIDKNRTILSWATDVEAIADSLDLEKFSIIGHSGGAPFVAACAYKIPHRLNGAAIVSGMAPFEYPQATASLAPGQRRVNNLIKKIPWIAAVMMKLTSFMIQKPGMLKQMLKQLPEVDQLVFHDPKQCQAIIHATQEAFRNGVTGTAQEMILTLKRWGFDLQDIKCPVTIWQGALDKQAPISHATLYANLIPDAKYHLIEHEGHHSLIRNYSEKILHIFKR